MSDWVIVYRSASRDRDDIRSPALSSKEAALSFARALMHQHCEVHRIEGPHGQVIGKEEIERWAAANPERHPPAHRSALN
jgi:hypothetical protein